MKKSLTLIETETQTNTQFTTFIEKVTGTEDCIWVAEVQEKEKRPLRTYDNGLLTPNIKGHGQSPNEAIKALCKSLSGKNLAYDGGSKIQVITFPEEILLNF